MDKLVSIIVPVYNVQEYLDECLISIIKQTYVDIEVILIDDGSTDSSLSICKKYAAEDKRLIIISQKNQGVSVARNAGLEIAKGDFITFIDSDDFVKLDYIEQLVSEMKEDVDLVCCSVPGELSINYCKITKMIQMAELFVNFGYTWGKLIRRTCIKEFFPADIRYAEDFVFYVTLMGNLRAITVIEYEGYHYRIRIGSLSAKDSNQKHTIDEFVNKSTFIFKYEKNMNNILKYEQEVQQIIDSHCYYICCLLLLLVRKLEKEKIFVKKESVDLIFEFMKKKLNSFIYVTVIEEKKWKRVGLGVGLLVCPKITADLANKLLR